MAQKGLKFLAQSHDYCRKVDVMVLTVLEPQHGDLCMYGVPMEFKLEKIEDDALDAAREPTFSLDFKSAQSLLDALLAAGIKPSTPADESKQVEAMKYHLEDMRMVAFEKIRRQEAENRDVHELFAELKQRRALDRGN